MTTRHKDDIAAMPGKLGAGVEIAADQRKKAIEGERAKGKAREGAE